MRDTPDAPDAGFPGAVEAMQARAQNIRCLVRLAEQYRVVDQETCCNEAGLAPIAERALKEAKDIRLTLGNDIADLLARATRRGLEPAGLSWI